jgi:hypothetical protein
MFNELGAPSEMFVSAQTVVATTGAQGLRATTATLGFRVVLSTVIACVAASFFVWGPAGRKVHRAPEGHYSSATRDERVEQATRSTVALRLVRDSRIVERLMQPDEEESSIVDPDHGM